MVKILRPPQRKYSVTTVSNQSSNSISNDKMPKYIDYIDAKDPFAKMKKNQRGK